jgi:hypothetical protein
MADFDAPADAPATSDPHSNDTCHRCGKVGEGRECATVAEGVKCIAPSPGPRPALCSAATATTEQPGAAQHPPRGTAPAPPAASSARRLPTPHAPRPAQVGHWSRECPEAPSGGGGGGGGGDGNCYNCGQPGHISRNCPDRQGGGGGGYGGGPRCYRYACPGAVGDGPAPEERNPCVLTCEDGLQPRPCPGTLIKTQVSRFDTTISS